MTTTPEDVAHEEGLKELYDDFKEHYEDAFILERSCGFYDKNTDILEQPIANLVTSRKLLIKGYNTASFLHSIISIETSIKSVVFKPIIFSLSHDARACDVLFNLTFKFKSIPEIPPEYFKILEDTSSVKLKELKRKDMNQTLYAEIKKLQGIRNSVVHQGSYVSKDEAQLAYEVASYVIDDVIPNILDSYGYHIKDAKIAKGGLRFANFMKGR